MSRIGKQPITIPEGIKVEIKDNTLKVSGPKGELQKEFSSKVKIKKEDNQIRVEVLNTKDKEQAALWGLSRSLIANMILGVSTSFEKKLEINGVGYKAAISSDQLVLNVGFSHPVGYKVPQGVEIKVEKNIVTISGSDKQLVGQVAAEIRSIRKPEPYKGKGIKYVDEVIRRKVGKTAGKGEE